MNINSYVSFRLRCLPSYSEHFLIENMLSILEHKFNIFKIRHGSMDGQLLVRIDDPNFWDDFNKFYYYLYPKKSYFVWYRYIMSDNTLKISNTRLKIGKTKRDFILKRDGNQCVICNTESNLTVDHVTPLSKGGDNSFYNLVTMCHKCNYKKRDYDYGFNFIKDVVVNHIKKMNKIS